MNFTKEGVDWSVDKLKTASVYIWCHNQTLPTPCDGKTIATHAVDAFSDAINVLDVFFSCYTVISAAVSQCKRFVNKHL